mgnify:CR=1 FL=1
MHGGVVLREDDAPLELTRKANEGEGVVVVTLIVASLIFGGTVPTAGPGALIRLERFYKIAITIACE